MWRTIAVFLLALSPAACQAQSQQSNFDCNNFFNFGTSAAATLQQFTTSPETMAWNWFTCLNQSADANGLNRVWELLKPTDQVYLANGAALRPKRTHTSCSADSGHSVGHGPTQSIS